MNSGRDEGSGDRWQIVAEDPCDHVAYLFSIHPGLSRGFVAQKM